MRRVLSLIPGLTLIVVFVLAGLQWQVLQRLQRAESRLDLLLNPVDKWAERHHDENRLLELLARADQTSWVGTDTPVQARITVHPETSIVAHDVRVLAEVRNASQQEQTIGGFYFLPFMVRLYHNGKEMRFNGPVPQMIEPSPIVLKPGDVKRALVTLDLESYFELYHPGTFRIEWTYHSHSSSKGLTWTGSLPTVSAEWRSLD